MSALKEMDLGIEVVVALLAAAVLLTVAVIGPKPHATFSGIQPKAQFRTQLDFSVTPGKPARLGAIQPAFGLSKQA
ncbi:MAG: hypothetical protein ACKVQA_09720 [Burkholderiales bacterium]